jgi:hypothetical protein
MPRLGAAAPGVTSEIHDLSTAGLFIRRRGGCTILRNPEWSVATSTARRTREASP